MIRLLIFSFKNHFAKSGRNSFDKVCSCFFKDFRNGHGPSSPTVTTRVDPAPTSTISVHHSHEHIHERSRRKERSGRRKEKEKDPNKDFEILSDRMHHTGLGMGSGLLSPMLPTPELEGNLRRAEPRQVPHL